MSHTYGRTARAGHGTRPGVSREAAVIHDDRTRDRVGGGAPPGEGSDYRIDELARLAGTTVRNVRAYQDRGLLPAPRREGRVGLYSEAHLARLRLIGTLLERGYTLANIGELVGAWEAGQDIGALLGFEAALTAPWSEEAAVTLSARELAELVGVEDEAVAARALESALALGILEADGTEFRVVSPRTLEAGVLLVRAGVPLDTVIAMTERMHADIDDVAHQFVDLVDRHVFDPLGQPLPASALPTLATLLERLRPLAKLTVEAELSRAMDRHIGERFGERMAALLDRGAAREVG